VITDLALYLRGAFNYYEPGVAFGEARELDRWIRRRVMLYYWTDPREAHVDGEAKPQSPTQEG
jgi:hypothetical protein